MISNFTNIYSNPKIINNTNNLFYQIKIKQYFIFQLLQINLYNMRIRIYRTLLLHRNLLNFR